MLKIGNLLLKNYLIMAPMAGITNPPFRLIAKRLGAGLVVTEMVSAVGLSRGHEKTFRYLESTPEEKPLSVQIFGADPYDMAMAAEIAVEKGADLVDINMGCPARKVVKNGAGGALLRNPAAVRDMVAAVRKVCTVPLTVKIRSGWSHLEANFLEIAGIIEDCGADAVAVHPRFVKQGFSGQADWGIIREVKKNLGIPIIGNGDVFKPALALKMREETGCDGVMIGRGAMGNPWIFRQILDLEQGLEARLLVQIATQRLLVEQFLLHPGIDQTGPFTADVLGVDAEGQFRLQIRFNEGDITHPGDRPLRGGGFFTPDHQQSQGQGDVGDATHI